MSQKSLTLRQLQERFDAQLLHAQGDEKVLGIATLEHANPHQLSFVTERHYLKLAQNSQALGFICPPKLSVPARSCLQVQEVWTVVKYLLEFFYPQAERPRGISPLAFIGQQVKLAPEVRVGPFAVIEDGVEIGEGSTICAQCFIGKGARVGNHVLLHPRVTVLPQVSIGNRVIIHSGAVLGSDGFRFEVIGGKLEKIPQRGTVVIEDDVEIGANVCIDRAMLDTTVLRRGAKIDNLVQIAHNVEIGEGSILVGQVGVAGSTKIGKGVILAGQVGIADNLHIGDGARVGAQGGVMNDLEPGGRYMGTPALTLREFTRIFKAMCRLPELEAKLENLLATQHDENNEPEK